MGGGTLRRAPQAGGVVDGPNKTLVRRSSCHPERSEDLLFPPPGVVIPNPLAPPECKVEAPEIKRGSPGLQSGVSVAKRGICFFRPPPLCHPDRSGPAFSRAQL